MNPDRIELSTTYLPAGRTDPATIRRQKQFVAENASFRAILDTIPNAVVILNRERQIVYANAAFAGLSPEPELMDILGHRVGEALHCRNANEGPDGCGTSTFCSTCGAAHAQAAAAHGQRSVEECHIMREVDGALVPLDLRVTAIPHEIAGESFTLFVISNIGDEKRRQVLERIFFHDISNTAGTIRGLAELLTATGNDSDGHFARMVYQASDRLLDEIEGQRQLLAAEEGVLEVALSPITMPHFLEEMTSFYRAHPVASECSLQLEPGAALIFNSDPALLGRVLGNMLKNALEAVPAGGKVRIGYRAEAEQIRFWVQNPGRMPTEVQLQLFHRSFSTKSIGRGLGTYSMKLLAEQYLGGEVDFTSNVQDGTTFTVTLPRH